MEVTREAEEMAKSKLETAPKGETEQQEGGHQSRKQIWKDAKQGKKGAKKDCSLPARRKISTYEPGEERDRLRLVVENGAGMEKGMERSRERYKSSKRPLSDPSSPTDNPRSKPLTSRAQRMREMTEDWAQVTEPKDKNQNSFPDGEVGPSRSNGF